MRLLTKNTDYAVRALLELGTRDGAVVSAREISEKQEIPYAYLRKILQALIREGIVVSREGVHGGVLLKKKPAQVGIVDVIRIFQGDISLSACMFRKKICPNRGRCVLRQNILQVEDTVMKEFGKLTLGKLLKQTQPKRSRG